MTPDDLTFPQPPTMTREHAHAIRLMVTLWPYPTAVPHYLIAEVAEHLEALIAQPVPSKATVYYPPDWSEAHASNYDSSWNWQTQYDPPKADDCYGDCDQ